jgi:hypothetical protein
MSAFKKFDPYATVLKPNGAAPKVAKMPKVSSLASRPEVTLDGLGTLGGLAANIAKPESSPPLGRPDQKGRKRAHPMRWRVPDDWTEGLKRMRHRPCPIAINPKHWLLLQDAAMRFVELWGEQAAALGWSALDIFGCHPTHPADRYETMGLVWMIADAEVVAMGAEVANIRNAAGALQMVWKCPVSHGRILLWDL